MHSHIAPWQCIFAKEDKNKCKPGIPLKSDKEYFEVLSLCILQAGLNWGMIRKRWLKLKQGFCDFEIDTLARSKVYKILEKPNVIKNRKKVEAIVNNAKEFEKIKQEFGSFQKFLKTLKNMENSKAIKLVAQRFAYLGEYSAEYFLHSVGYWP